MLLLVTFLGSNCYVSVNIKDKIKKIEKIILGLVIRRKFQIDSKIVESNLKK